MARLTEALAKRGAWRLAFAGWDLADAELFVAMLLLPSHRVLLLPILAESIVCCGNAVDHALGDASGGPNPIPTDHRLQDVACPEERGPGSANVVRDCTQDSECTEGMNGRCISPNVLGSLGGSSCSYDTCFGDSDCPLNEPCRCRQSAADNAPNYCVARKNCRIDSDCGPRGFCSPSLLGIDSSIIGSAEFGYFCHTPQDRCLNDDDCDPAACGLPSCASMACGYSPESDHWDCFMVSPH